jgi:hypothetical protein
MSKIIHAGMYDEQDHNVESDACKILYNFMVEQNSRVLETEFFIDGKKITMELKITSINGRML